MSTFEEIIAALDMKPHPEGGFFAETFRDEDGADGRGHSTAIYYLLGESDRSAWHRVTDAVEVWHHYAGAPLALTLSPDGHASTTHTLGPDVLAGERPQVIVPKNHWQTARPIGGWALVGCTVAPAFRFEGFEMAPPDWEPSPR